MDTKYLPAPPPSLKKQFKRGLVTITEARLCLEAYNLWAAHWNVVEKAFQAYEVNDPPCGEAHDGHRIMDLHRPSRLYWHPRGQDLVMVARVRFKIDCFYPKPPINLADLIWATWGYFGGEHPFRGIYK